MVSAINMALAGGSAEAVGAAAATWYRGGAHTMSSLQQAAAGTLVRIFDGMSDWERPWMPCSAHGACTAPHRKEGDRWPATFLNRRHGGTYSGLCPEA